MKRYDQTLETKVRKRAASKNDLRNGNRKPRPKVKHETKSKINRKKREED